MTKCDYCGEKIGLFSNTWLDKKKDLIVHNKCLEEWHIKFEDQLKEIERLNKIDYKTLSENERHEFREKSDKFFDNIPKNVLYFNHYKPNLMRIPTHDELIRCCEDLIEKIENDENFLDKENVLRDLNNILEKLRREGRIIFK